MKDTTTKAEAKTKTKAPRHAKGDGTRNLTPKQFRFVLAYCGGLDQKNATIAAGYSAKSSAAAYDLMHTPAVRAAIDEMHSKLRAKTTYEAADAFREAGEAIEFAKETKNANALVRALELRARLNGLLTEKVSLEVEHTIDIAGALDAARARVLRPMRDPAQIEDGEFTPQSNTCDGGSRDYESLSALPAPPGPPRPDMDS